MLLEAAQLLHRGAAAKSTPAWKADALKRCQALVQHLSYPLYQILWPTQGVILLLLLSTGIYMLSQQQEAFHTCCLRCLLQLCPAPAALGNLHLTQTSPVLLHPVQVPCRQLQLLDT